MPKRMLSVLSAIAWRVPVCTSGLEQSDSSSAEGLIADGDGEESVVEDTEEAASNGGENGAGEPSSDGASGFNPISAEQELLDGRRAGTAREAAQRQRFDARPSIDSAEEVGLSRARQREDTLLQIYFK